MNVYEIEVTFSGKAKYFISALTDDEACEKLLDDINIEKYSPADDGEVTEYEIRSCEVQDSPW